jgi:MFS family permease
MLNYYLIWKRKIKLEISELNRDGRGWILMVISAGWFLSLGIRTVFPALLPYFESEFNMSLTTAGLLLSVLWGAYALGQFPGGVLGNRYGERDMLTFSTAMSTIAIVLIATAHSARLLFIGTISFGFATALFGPLRFTIFTRVFPDRTGTVVGITMASGNLGNAILPIFAGIMASFAVWQYSFWLIAPLFAITTVAMWIHIPPSNSESHIRNDVTLASISNGVKQLTEGIKQKGIVRISMIEILMSIVVQGFVGFYPVYLITVKNVSATVATTLFGIFFASAILVQPLVGILQDHIGSKQTLFLIMASLFISLLGLFWATTLPVLLFLTLLASSRAGTPVINNTYVASALPVEIQASGLGILRTGWLAVGALSPIAIGVLGDQGLLREAFVLLAILTGIGLLFVMSVPSLDVQTS